MLLEVRFSPRLDPVVVKAVLRMDVEEMSIADVWRAAGSRAVETGSARPGYHSILRIVLDERRRRVERRNAIAEAIDEAWSTTGTDYEKLVVRLASTRRR